MTKKKLIAGLLLCFTFFVAKNVLGQSLSLGGSFNPSPWAALHFDTYADCVNTAGKTASEGLIVSYNPQGNYATTSGYTLKVSSTDFINSSNSSVSIPAQYVSLTFNSYGGNSPYPSITSSGEVALSSTLKTLVTFTTPLTVPSYYYTQLFDVHVAGGNQLLVPLTGNYTATLTLNFCNASGTVVSSTTAQVYFEIGYAYDNTCGLCSVCGGNTVTISNVTASAYTSLKASDYVSTDNITSNKVKVIYNSAATCTGWSLKVRANGNFVGTNGNTISPDHISLAFNNANTAPSGAAIGVTNAPVALSTSEVTLINNSQAAFTTNTNYVQSFDMIIAGGYYLQAAGSGSGSAATFTANLTFTLYNSSGAVVSTNNVDVSFVLIPSSYGKATLSLADNTINLAFSTNADYVNGVSVTKTNSLHVVASASNAYQIIVSASDPNLKNGANNVPVSVIHIANAVNPANADITSTAVNLNYSSPPTIINNSMSNQNNDKDTYYDITYSIPGGNSSIAQAPGGTYTVYITYTYVAP